MQEIQEIQIWLEIWIGKIPLEKEMTTHSSIFAWKIPQTEEPAGLQSLGLERVRHDLATGKQQYTNRRH